MTNSNDIRARKGLGHIPDPVGHRMTSARHLVSSVKRTPPRFTLRDWTPPIGDQGRPGSCVGWGESRGIVTSLSYATKTHIPLYAPMGIYTVGRCIDREDPRTPLQDVGSMPNQCLRGIEEWGVATQAEWPYVEANVNDEPDLSKLQKISSDKVIGAYRLDETGQSLDDRACAILASGIAIPIAIAVDNAFYDYRKGSALLTTPHGEIFGGHYICVIGFDKLRVSGDTVYEIANSWSKDEWGDEGYCYARSSFLHAASDRYAMKAKLILS